jgi:hypothetical protein
VVGRVFEIKRGSATINVATPATFVTDGLAPVGQRTTLALVFGAGLVLLGLVLLVLSVFGITRWAIRNTRKRRTRVCRGSWRSGRRYPDRVKSPSPGTAHPLDNGDPVTF